MQQYNQRPQRKIEINDKLTDERYKNKLIDDKESDKKYQISKEYIVADISS